MDRGKREAYTETKRKKQAVSVSSKDLLARKVYRAAQDLFDNRLGWDDNRNPYAPRKFWGDLSEALYGENDSRTIQLRKEKAG